MSACQQTSFGFSVGSNTASNGPAVGMHASAPDGGEADERQPQVTLEDVEVPSIQTAHGFTLLLTALSLQWGVLANGFFDALASRARVLGGARLGVSLATLLDAEVGALATLVSFGALVGRVSLLQATVLAIIETVFYAANRSLVLADGVAHASAVPPKVGAAPPELIIDMATLTGAQMIATGKRHAGVVANTDEVEAAAVAAGKRSGDLAAPLPYAPEFYRNEFKSKVADMKNSQNSVSISKIWICASSS